MLPILAIAALTITPTITFTTDSAYKNENVLIMEVKENYEGDVLVSKDLVFRERNLLGYAIYDNPDTYYIEGLRFDGEAVYNWTIKNYDDTVEHTIMIKTTYTDDVAGMLASAKDGDWSKILANPLVIVTIAYYLLSCLAIIGGGFGIAKSKKRKVKDHDEIASTVDERANEKTIEMKNNAVLLFKAMFAKTQTHTEALIKAFILAQSGDKNAKVALLDLLRDTTNENVNVIADEIIKQVEEEAAAKEKAKEEAKEAVAQIASGNFDEGDGTGGISI